jgi:hypothetical protein
MSGTRTRPLVKGGIPLGIAAALTVAAPTASGTSRSPAAVKPVIGQPVAAPAQPVAGKRFTVSFKVKRSDTGAPLTSGRMSGDPSVAGKIVPHRESFRGGMARLSLIVPANAAGKLLKVRLTIRAGSQSATRVANFRIRGLPKPSISIGQASILEGNTGTTTLSFHVALSAASTQTISVRYATADGTAAAPGDYAAANGTLTFAPGELAKTIPVSVVADTAVEQDEAFTVAISDPVNATIAAEAATGTIRNDDVAPRIAPGAYRGATQDGNYVFLTVLPNQTITGFRVNDLSERCEGGLTLRGGVDWSDNTFPIRGDGSFAAEGSWTGSIVVGDAEFTSWYAKLTGRFDGTTVSGTVLTTEELKYKGTPYRCTTGEVRWSATLQS